MSVRRVRRIYDRSAPRYERGMAFTDRLLGDARREVGEASRGTVLEVGIGTGLSLPWYGAPVERVVGVDLSPGMLRECRARAAEAGIPVDLLEADAQRLPFGDSQFDSIVFSLCLCTIPDPGRALREALRVARPGAPILCLEHVRSHLPVVGVLQDLITPLTRWLAADTFNRRTEAAVRAAGVEAVTARRWALGAMTLISGRAPLDHGSA